MNPQMDIAKLNEALAFVAEHLKPITHRIFVQMVQGAIIPAPAPEVPEKASAEAEAGVTNG